jgi:hypothetical protein
MSDKDERRQILEMIDSGTITPAEGARLLNALSDESQDPRSPSEPAADPYLIDPDPNVYQSDRTSRSEEWTADEMHEEVSNEPEVLDTPFDPSNVEKWRRWWTIPLWIGVGITIIGGVLMYAAMQAAGASSFWFACAWLPFLLGIAILVIAWSSRSARWIHIRVRQKPGERPQNIALNFPLPIRLTAWVLRHFGHYIPKMEHTGLDEIILALEDNTSPDAPFYVEVDEGEDGEKVEIYIG